MPEEDLHLSDQTRFQAHKPQTLKPGLRYQSGSLGRSHRGGFEVGMRLSREIAV